MDTHYREARKVAENGQVAVVIPHPPYLATLAFDVMPGEEEHLYSEDDRERAMALLCFIEEAHRQLARDT